MAIYTDPHTGHRKDVELVTPAVNSASWGVATLVIVLAVLGWFAYGIMDRVPRTETNNAPGTTTTDTTTELAPAAAQPASPAEPRADTAPDHPVVIPTP